MLKFLTTLLLAIVFTSCVNKPINNVNPDKPQDVKVEKFILDAPYEVPITAGKISVLTYNNDTIAVTDIPMTVRVPKGETKSGGLQLSTHDYAEMPNFVPGCGIRKGVYTLLFEDSKNGDYDYNDLVLFVETEVKNAGGGDNFELTLRVKPIALGSAKLIAFGYDDNYGGGKEGEHIISTDVRRDYFGGKPGIINAAIQSKYEAPIQTIRHEDNSTEGWYTYAPSEMAYNTKQPGSYMICKNFIIRNHKMEDKTPLQDKEVSTGYIQYAPRAITDDSNNKNTREISFFIIVDNGIKLPIAVASETIDASLPYGLAIPFGAPHPYENMIISKAFPDFDQWISGNGFYFTKWYLNVHTENSFTSHMDKALRW